MLADFNKDRITGSSFPASGSVNPRITPNALQFKAGDTRYLIDQFVDTDATGNSAFGLNWKREDNKGHFPEYFKKIGNNWIPIDASEVPEDTGLSDQVFMPKAKGRPFTSSMSESCYSSPGPVAGPFKVTLVDGTTVTYSWYKFIDQPAFQRLNLSTEEKNRLQARIEKMHREWTIDKTYIPAPSSGSLVKFDENIIVSPPRGFEVGFVPIVTRQEK